MDKNKTIRSKSPDSLLYLLTIEGGFSGGTVEKTMTANVGDGVWSLGLGRSPGEGMATHSSILAWRIPDR